VAAARPVVASTSTVGRAAAAPTMNSGEIILNSAEQKINKNKKDSEQ
jgi:hypothetical protein